MFTPAAREALARRCMRRLPLCYGRPHHRQKRHDRMNSILLRAFIILIAVLVSPASLAVVVDSVVATVGREPILYSEVYRDAQEDIDQIRQRAPNESAFQREVDRVMMAALDQLIESRILHREALLRGLEVSDERVEERIASLRDFYPTNEAFLQDLEDAGETMRDFRERIRKRLLAQTMAFGKLRELERNAVVSQDAIQEFYNENLESFRRPERVRVRQIFLAAPAADPEALEAARARLTLIREELRAGAEFQALARQYSEAPGAEDGGIIGWQRRGDLIPVLDDAAFSLNEGEASDILESSAGVHLLYIEERQEAGLADLDEVRNEIEPEVRSQIAQDAYDKWIGELRKRSRVRVFI